MAYTQYTRCVKPSDYTGPVNLPGAAVVAGILGAVTLNVGVAALTAVIAGLAFCRWWLYGRLVCLGGQRCAIGLALEVFPPEDKTGLDREDTDYSVNLLLAPSTLYEGFNQACQDTQGVLMQKSSDPDFQTMMGKYRGLGFTGEPEPFSGLVNPEGQLPGIATWQPNTMYQPGMTIQMVSSDFRTFVQTCDATGPSGPSAPNWGVTIGAVTQDGITSWVCTSQYQLLTQQALLAMGLVNPGEWAGQSAFSVGDLVLVSNTGGSLTQSVQVCTTAGTSEATAPNWPMAFGVVTDESASVSMGTSTVQWTCLGVGGRWAPTYLDSTSYAWHKTPYLALDCVIDHNGALQQCTTAGNSGSTIPAWSTVLGGATADGDAQWKQVTSPVFPSWQSATAYLLGDVITDANGNLQLCTTAGSSGASAPTWAAAAPQTTADNGVVWTFVETPAWRAWQPSTNYLAGTQIIDSNNAAQTCISSGTSGAAPPAWGVGDGIGTTDTGPGQPAGWINIGEAISSIGTIEVEFEGGGMYDLYQGLLVALPLAIAAAAAGAASALAILGPAAIAAAAAAATGPWGWLLAILIIIVALIAQAIVSALASAPAVAAAGAGFLTGEADVASPAADDPNIGTIYPGTDVLVVMGSWIYDSAHSGWNELHPVLHCQKIASTGVGDLAAGDPWVNLPQFSAANLETTLNQHTAVRTGWCPLIHEAGDKDTTRAQREPQNRWTIHPLIDGCTPRQTVR